MKCAWKAYINLLPLWMREDVDRLGRDSLQELRLRIGRPPELRMKCNSKNLNREVRSEDLSYCVNAASRYSPWSVASMSQGFITALGGHRLGICGEVTVQDGRMKTVAHVTSLCIRVARDFPGIGLPAANLKGSTLVIGSPGSGKTTLLREIIRQKSSGGFGAVGVVDERKELFPIVGDSFCFSPGLRTDVISGCSKAEGVEILLRTMNPQWIAVDEITAEADCQALIQSARCGVSLLATAHAENSADLVKRQVYKPLIEHGIFENYIQLFPDKSWVLERVEV